MRLPAVLAIWGTALLLAACSSIEIQSTDSSGFAAAGYKYYAWRSEPLKNPRHSSDPLYLMDSIIRSEVDATLAEKGYVLDPQRAQFTVDYLQAMGLQQGVASWDASGGIDPIPSARPNRHLDQAMVDNANALAGVRETDNIALLFNDAGSHSEVWRVLMTKIVENVNETDPEEIASAIRKGVDLALKELPDAN